VRRTLEQLSINRSHSSAIQVKRNSRRCIPGIGRRNSACNHLVSSRNLHREGADVPRGAIDQDPLPGSNVAVIAKRLEGDQAGHGDGSSLFESEVSRLHRQRAFGNGRILGKRAHAPAEDLVTWAEPWMLLPTVSTCHATRTSDTVLWLARPVHCAGDVRQAAHDRPVTRVDLCRPKRASTSPSPISGLSMSRSSNTSAEPYLS
jgi:hypothetical protein